MSGASRDGTANNGIARNWQELTERVARAAERAGRRADEIGIVAVTKTRPATDVDAALAAGATDVGENRVQEADGKKAEVCGTARWHLIGQLQRNKAGRAVELFDVIHSIDSTRLADAVDRRAADAGRAPQVLLQVNTSGAEQQGGAEPEDLPGLVEHVVGCDHLQLRGLMTIGAHTDDVGAVRACFQRLRGLAEQERRRGHPVEALSMGMSGDFEIAIEEGATLIRVGSVLFGERG